MRLADERHFAELLHQAATGSLSRSDAVALFMYVREDLPAGSMAKDIGHTIAHNRRDRGYAFRYVNDFVDHLAGIITSGGTLVVDVLFEIHDVIDELADFAEAQGVVCDRDLLHQASTALIPPIASVVDGTEIVLKRPGVVASFSATPFPTIAVQFAQAIDGVLKVPADTIFAFPLLDGDTDLGRQPG